MEHVVYTENEVTDLCKAGYYFIKGEWACDGRRCYSTLSKNENGAWSLYYNFGFDSDEGHDDEDWETFDTLTEALDFL